MLACFHNDDYIISSIYMANKRIAYNIDNLGFLVIHRIINVCINVKKCIGYGRMCPGLDFFLNTLPARSRFPLGFVAGAGVAILEVRNFLRLLLRAFLNLCRWSTSPGFARLLLELLRNSLLSPSWHFWVLFT